MGTGDHADCDLECGILDPVSLTEGAGLTLTRDQFEEMLVDVRRHSDEEACGLAGGILSTVEKIYPITNALHSSTRFRMDATEQVRALMEIEQNGWELLAIYHSHVKGPGRPSETDTKEFAYPGVAYLIFDLSDGGQELRGFRMDGGKWVEIAITITG